MLTPTDPFPFTPQPPGTYWRIGDVREHFEAHFYCPSASVADRYAVQVDALADKMRCPVAIEVTREEIRLRLETQLINLILVTALVLGHDEMLAKALDES
jgi:hypothetical protein